MPYNPIEDHGVIGDLHTVALVGKDGRIDWCCLPHFDSPSVFGALLDDAKGGHFGIHSEGEQSLNQLYLPDTNVLLTRFLDPQGISELVDFMPMCEKDFRGDHGYLHRIVRRASCVRGEQHMRLSCRPAFDYARREHRVEIRKKGAIFHADGFALGLASPVPLEADGEGGVRAEFRLRSGECRDFFLSFHAGPGDPDLLLGEQDGEALLEETVDFWRRWLGRSHYTGRWREAVQRSVLSLKLMTYAPSGAMVAAPTTSLPEWIGGSRNWDYRYTWIRDASFTLYAFLRVGLTEEAEQFTKWLGARCAELEPGQTLQPLYGIEGQSELPEKTLGHLEGHLGSSPVRIGNAAASQIQNDVTGELMDAMYLYNKYGRPVSWDLWNYLVNLIDWVERNWEEPDNGVWEPRRPPRHYVYSKVFCWVAMDRALRLAEKRSLPAPRQRWLDVRDRIYRDVQKNGWDAELGSYTQSYGERAVDASNLVMPLVFFMSPSDPRMLSTLDRTMERLTEDALVRRYRIDETPDGLEGDEGWFTMCSFWLVEALTRSGDLKRARLLFEKVLSYSNHLGLYSEMVGPSGEALGNFPQAFTHIALVSAAFNLDRALEGGGIAGISRPARS